MYFDMITGLLSEYVLIVLSVGESKVPPVLYLSYSTVYVEAHAIKHGR